MAAPPYSEALKSAGYSGVLNFREGEIPLEGNDEVAGGNQQEVEDTGNAEARKKRKNRGRNCIWFNPPFLLSVKNNLTKTYYSIVERAFPKDHEYLGKLLNKNNMRISYSCTQNMASLVTSHNKKIIEKASKKECIQKKRSCVRGAICPLDGLCMTKEIIYETGITPLQMTSVRENT